MRPKKFLAGLYRECNDDAVGTTAAALTYYGVLSLFPFLISLVTIAGLMLDPAAVEGLLAQLERVAPAEVVKIVGDRLTALHQTSSGGLFTLGFVGALWAASGAVTALMQALNRIDEVRETRPWYRQRLLAIGVTLGAGVVAVLAGAVTFAVPVAARFIGGPLGNLLALARFPVAGLLMMAVWGFLYYILPSVRPRFRLITPGSIIGVTLWLLASWGFTQYVRNFGKYEATYGALGGVVILLVWMWISSMVVLLGAEINKLLVPGEKRRPMVAAPEPQPV